MKSRTPSPSFSSVIAAGAMAVVTTAVLLTSMQALAQTTPPAEPSLASPTPAAAETAPPAPAIPAEQSVSVRAEYEANMRILHSEIADKQWQKALSTIATLQSARPREPQARFLKTIVETELGDEVAAQAGLMSLVADFPELPEPHNNLATLYAKKGDYAAAQRELELALVAVPDYAIGHANLADLYLQQAAQHYQRSAALTASVKERKVLQAQADAVQMLLVPATKKPSEAASAEPAKEVATKDGAAKEDAAKDGGDFLSGSCDAPPGFGDGKDDDSPFGGTCEINFDEPAPEPKSK